MLVNYRKLNPNGFYLLKFMNDVSLRFIILFGGSSSGKSFSVAQTVLIQTLLDSENSLVLRKVGASCRNTIYEDFRVAANLLGISKMFRFMQNCIRCSNGARIDFGGLDDSEKIKGISNYKRVLLEELSEFDLIDLKQVRKRLRGKIGQQIIATFNPISELHWIKKEWLDMESWHDVPMEVEIGGVRIPDELCRVKSVRMNEGKKVMNPRTGEIEHKSPNMVIIQSTYLNNFWVVGSPDGTYGFYDEQCIADFEYDRNHDPDYYNVYALGEWGVIRTGSEFFGSFNRGVHSGSFGYDSSLPIHMTVDNNVLPYISISYWQCDTSSGKRIWQFHETCASSPDNTVRKSAALSVRYLRSIRYSDRIFLHGDASTKSANTFDDEKRSWMDLFIETIRKDGFEVVDMVSKRNPSVAMTGEFINAVFDGQIEGISVSVDEGCRNSIEDYMSVQKDVNGGMLKTRIKDKATGQSYEEHGHLSDIMRYIVHDLCYEEYVSFANRRKRSIYTGIGLNFFNPESEYVYSDGMVYVMPSVNGRFCLVAGMRIGDRWHITDLIWRDTDSISEMKDAIVSYGQPCVVESGRSFYQMARELREFIPQVSIRKEYADIRERISATSDYVRTHFQFSPVKMNEGGEYHLFVTSVLDYSKDSEEYGPSAVISGFAYMAIRMQ